MKYPHIVVRDGVWYPAGTEVPVGVPIKVDLTDDVPEGALNVNADGSVNTYDEHGNAVGTVSAEEVDRLRERAGEAFAEQEKSKRGRKSKEA